MIYIYKYNDDYEEIIRLYRKNIVNREYLDKYFRPQKIIATVPYSNNNRGVRPYQKMIISSNNIGIKNYRKEK